MYELDKAKFGAFLAALRKGQGMTQRELAERLCVSDKAVSKWETGVSIPDTALLIPLGEILGVTVTELLLGRRMEAAMEPEEVEGLVQTAISYSGGPPLRAWQEKGGWQWAYGPVLLAGLAGLYANWRLGGLTEPVLVSAMLSAIFGAYFCFFARMTLPKFYDENPIGGVFDGIFRMNMPGLTFNNRNWPHMIRAGRVWSLGNLAGFPLLALTLRRLYPEFWGRYESNVMLVLTLGGLILPLYWVGWKHRD